ncbi:SDR family NAD(P)-dependent oxidoreductase [Aeromicrobium sp. CF4.19]|uniref:SDR family NAD(P)-dependent oxidoreductase n=1 Tax=Aeromicrobium sp. CF4.19 TaxID=3373082 RepID=UPI003EE46EB6
MPLTIVTGASRGIGAAIALRLAHDGHDVVVTYHRDRSAADGVVREIEGLGRHATAVALDVTDEDSIATMTQLAAGLGTVTGLVNNAGGARAVGPLAENTMADVRADLELNLVGTIACSKSVLEVMGRGAAIVNLSSAAATIGSPGTYVHYAAAKAGVDAFTLGLARELGPEGIRVNAVAPGTTWTDFHRDPDRPAKVARSVPLGRAAQPEEIAGAVSWLLSSDAGYTTGTVLRVAGGQ